MLKASGGMAIATLTSRLLGMVREMVYAWFMGDGWVAWAFQTAFTIPNLFRRLLGEGALTAAFIPIFKEKEKKEGEAEMWRVANAVISGLVVSASVVIALVMLIVTAALNVHEFPVQVDLMLHLLRVMFPYMLLVCVAAVLMGMLNARGHFFIPALGAVVLNIVMIASVWWVAPTLGLDFPAEGRLPKQIFALAGGVLVAGVAQAAFQLPTLLSDGFRYRWVSPWRDETVRRVVRKMIPGAIGVAAFQINVAVIQGMGAWLDTPGHPVIVPFNYAVRLMELPQGIFGISLATFLLTTLSALAVEKNYAEFRATLRQGMAHLILVNLLMAVLLVMLAEPIMRLLFERGKFGPDSSARATLALQYLGASLVAYSLVNLVARAFYALGDTRTPMKISIVCLVLNLILSVCLVMPFRQAGLGLANTISSAVNLALLLYALRRKLGKLELASLRATFPSLVLATVLATVVAWWGGKFWETNLGHATLALKLGAVFVPASIASLVYWLAAVVARVPAAQEITGLLAQKFRR